MLQGGIGVLKVLIDATAIPAEQLGVGHYVFGLVGGLAAAGSVDLHLIAKRRDVEALGSLGQALSIHAASPRSRPSRLVWEQTVLPARIRRLAPAVFHGPHYSLPAPLPCPGVVTFHDPTFFTHPELHERAKVAYFTRMARIGAKRAGRVIAISEYARAGAVEHAGADPDKVDVVYHGIDLDRYCPDDAQAAADERLRARVGVDGSYLFWIGAHEPRKDVPSLVGAFAGLVRAGADQKLVLAGPRAWGADAVDAAIAASGAQDRILCPGYISEAEKIALYRGADALVYPSIAEGFGLQVLEAMACGCPVVTTTGSAPEEVSGSAAELVAPGDPAELTRAIERALEPARSAELRKRGLERARGFTWERTAHATLASYARAR